MEIIGHRGASHDAPENTLASINLAWRQQADAVEIDVFLTADGQVVAIHDDTPLRYGGPDIPVEMMTLAQLRAIDVGRWKDPRFAGERVPLLSEALATIPSGKRMLIEVKASAAIVVPLLAVLERRPLSPRATALIGFDLPTMEALKRTRPALDVYWVIAFEEDAPPESWTGTTERMISLARKSGLDALDLGNGPAVNRDFVTRVHAAGLGVYVWTVNEPSEAIRLREAGVDGIATDRPGWMRERLAEGC